MSTVPPGENGDGQKASRAALANKGTESTAPTPLTPPGAPAVPPPPIPQRVTIARADDTFAGPQTSGRSASILPAAERRSPAEGNTPPGDDDLLPNDPALGQEEQILPYKPKDVIGIRSSKPAYPQVVVALTRPPGSKLASERNDPLNDVVLANRVTADVSGSPPIQPATAALDVPRQRPEDMARLLGPTDPLNGLVRVDAMTHPAGAQPLEGGDAPLPELVQADRPTAAETRDAIESLTAPDPKPLEMAQAIEPTPIAATTAASPSPQPPVATANTAVASAAKASGGLPGPTAAAADPAPDTGLESDPFAKIPGVEFHPGKVEARSGRQIKPVRPRLSEAGKRDLLAQAFPTILLKVRIDKTGKVVDVSIVHGSGNEAIDMPVYRALWEWWFEPPTDKKGNPMEDVQLVAIHWG
jgi:protein TonB